MKPFLACGWLAVALVAGGAAEVRCENIHDVASDLRVPAITKGDPGPGKRVKAVTNEWRQTDVHHLLYLPNDWRSGRSYPVLVEFPGNGGFRNDLGDVSDGTPASCMLGYGLSGGSGFLWVSLPFVDVAADGTQRNCLTWWGNLEATKKYCLATVRDICQRYGGDEASVILCGFSRGAIACNYVGLHDDTIATLWCGFFCHSHYDGVRTWPYPDSDRDAAIGRLGRLGNRPQWISHERSVANVATYIEESGVDGSFTLVPIPYPNHSAAWVLRDIPERAAARRWLHRTVHRQMIHGGGSAQ